MALYKFASIKTVNLLMVVLVLHSTLEVMRFSTSMEFKAKESSDDQENQEEDEGSTKEDTKQGVGQAVSEGRSLGGI